MTKIPEFPRVPVRGAALPVHPNFLNHVSSIMPAYEGRREIFRNFYIKVLIIYDLLAVLLPFL